MADASAGPGPVKVAAMVDLERRVDSGGHVKCWERLARAATRYPDEVDLTVFFSGPGREEVRLSDNVRYCNLPPVFSTRRLPFLGEVPDHTDLAFFHRGLARRLSGFDVLHTTDGFFAFALTAARVARRTGTPLVTSVHTDTPGYTRIYTTRTLRHLFGRGRFSHWLIDGLDLPGLAERRQRAKLAAHQAQAAAVLGAPGGAGPVLRRGVDREMFAADRSDRAWLERRFGVPPDHFVVLYAGRIDVGKNVMVLAEAVARLVAEGRPFHLICAGDGNRRADIADRLGSHASCPGVIDPALLGQIYASVDVFALPSRIEIHSNVVMEALASGTPVVVLAASGMDRMVADGETGRVITADGPGPWRDALAGLADEPEHCRAMHRAALAWADAHIPTWEDVLTDDLLPVWRRVAETTAVR